MLQHTLEQVEELVSLGEANVSRAESVLAEWSTVLADSLAAERHALHTAAAQAASSLDRADDAVALRSQELIGQAHALGDALEMLGNTVGLTARNLGDQGANTTRLLHELEGQWRRRAGEEGARMHDHTALCVGHIGTAITVTATVRVRASEGLLSVSSRVASEVGGIVVGVGEVVGGVSHFAADTAGPVLSRAREVITRADGVLAVLRPLLPVLEAARSVLG